MREQEVTLAVEKYLKQNNWAILSLNNPFAGKSIWVKPKGGFRGKGTLIPDIIANKDNFYMIVEAYEKLKIKDIEKLNKYSKLEYLDSLKEIFSNKNLKVIKVMTYPEPVKPYNYPKDFIILGVKKDFSVNVYFGNESFLNHNNDEFTDSLIYDSKIFL